ncbi:hypothetical protein [Corynebacterium bovis]|uniref:hypothetical protein n=1 Tax=Corynebacterium bovis TaxID=36808 RepID=UPI00313A3796
MMPNPKKNRKGQVPTMNAPGQAKISRLTTAKANRKIGIVATTASPVITASAIRLTTP